MALLRHFDLVLLAAALPVFVGAGLPLVGYGTVAVAWVGQRALQHALTRWARSAGDARRETGILIGAMMTRPLLLVGAIVAAGIVDRKAGLAAALLTAVIFSVYLGITLISGAMSSGRPTS